MDIFNKKKIEELRIVNDGLRKKRDSLNEKVDSLNKMNKSLESDKKMQSKEIERLLEENSKLIEWIKGIIKITHVCDTQNTLDRITIPIAINKRTYHLDNSEAPFIQEEVIIPSIRFTSLENDMWR